MREWLNVEDLSKRCNQQSESIDKGDSRSVSIEELFSECAPKVYKEQNSHQLLAHHRAQLP